MDSGKQVIKELERRLRLSEDKTFRFKRICRGQELRIEFTDIDRYSALVHRIEVAVVEESAQTSHVDLKQRSLTLSQKMSYFCNALNVMEIDSEHDRAQLRSDIDTHGDGSRTYFEFQLRSDFLSLEKYQICDGQRLHEQTNFFLSHDVLARLVNDLLDEVAAV